MKEGFVKLWRKTIESEIWKKPPLYFKVWFWLLSNAQYEDYRDLKRGQLWTSIDEIRNGVSYYVGYRKETPTRDVIFDIISWLRNPREGNDKAMMIATTKATRGLVITICNYDKYQSKKIYEGNTESNDETGAKPEGRQQDKERSSKEDKEIKNKDKILYGESVLLTEIEYQKLCERFGKEKTDDQIENLEVYSGMHPKEFKAYTSHYRAIIGYFKLDEKRKGVVIENNPCEKCQYFQNPYCSKYSDKRNCPKLGGKGR